MATRITKKTVDNFLQENFPKLAAWENPTNGDKGTYTKSIGQAFSFKTKGKTWRQVLNVLHSELEESR